MPRGAGPPTHVDLTTAIEIDCMGAEGTVSRVPVRNLAMLRHRRTCSARRPSRSIR